VAGDVGLEVVRQLMPCGFATWLCGVECTVTIMARFWIRSLEAFDRSDLLS